MRASVRWFHSPDAELEAFYPEDPEDVGILIQVMAGPSGETGAESFGVLVCTPRWIKRKILPDGPVIGRHLLIISEWSTREVLDFLKKMVELQEADTWTKLAERIGRIGQWEFEDYTE